MPVAEKTLRLGVNWRSCRVLYGAVLAQGRGQEVEFNPPSFFGVGRGAGKKKSSTRLHFLAFVGARARSTVEFNPPIFFALVGVQVPSKVRLVCFLRRLVPCVISVCVEIVSGWRSWMI